MIVEWRHGAIMKPEKSYVSNSINITFAVPKRIHFAFQKREGIVSIIYSCNQYLLKDYFVVDTCLAALMLGPVLATAAS